MSTLVKLKDVRLSYPVLFEAKDYQGNRQFKYGASAIIEPGSDNDKLLREAVLKECLATWPTLGKAQYDKLLKGDLRHTCFFDGDRKFEEDPEKYAAYEGSVILKASRKLEKGMPAIYDVPTRCKKDADGKTIKLTVDDGTIYGGCRGVFYADVYAWNSGPTKMTVATLVGFQKTSDDVSFGGASFVSENDIMVFDDDTTIEDEI